MRCLLIEESLAPVDLDWCSADHRDEIPRQRGRFKQERAGTVGVFLTRHTEERKGDGSKWKGGLVADRSHAALT